MDGRLHDLLNPTVLKHDIDIMAPHRVAVRQDLARSIALQGALARIKARGRRRRRGQWGCRRGCRDLGGFLKRAINGTFLNTSTTLKEDKHSQTQQDYEPELEVETVITPFWHHSIPF